MVKLGILENGVIETAKQEKVRPRLELDEFNNASKVLGDRPSNVRSKPVCASTQRQQVDCSQRIKLPALKIRGCLPRYVHQYQRSSSSNDRGSGRTWATPNTNSR